jgi:hypothetical protein
MIPTTRCRRALVSNIPIVHNFLVAKILGTSRTSRTSSPRGSSTTLPHLVPSLCITSRCMSTALPRTSMHFHRASTALPSLFHRSSTAQPCRKGLRLILRGGGCNRVPLLLFSRPFSSVAHTPPPLTPDHIPQLARPFAVTRSPRRRSSTARLARLSPFVMSLFRRLSVRSSPASALDRSTSRPSTLCAVPSKVSTPASTAAAACTPVSVRTSRTSRPSTLCAVPSKSTTLRSPYTFLVRSLRDSCSLTVVPE